MRAPSCVLFLTCIADAAMEDSDSKVDAAHGGHPYPPPGPKYHGWPTFHDKKSLEKDKWGHYYKMLYGEIPSHGYPIHPGDFHLLYDDLLHKAGVTHIPHSNGDCPSNGAPSGQRFKKFGSHGFQPAGTSWVLHHVEAVPAHTKVEVIHMRDPANDEKYGAWMFKAPGSGTYFDTGKTIKFGTHEDAARHFGVHTLPWDYAQMNQQTAQKAAAQGYDTIQYTAWKDPVEYACCKYCTMGLEMVAAKFSGKPACLHDPAPSHGLYAGWGGSRHCKCDNRQESLNCHGHGEQLSANSSSVIV